MKREYKLFGWHGAASSHWNEAWAQAKTDKEASYWLKLQFAGRPSSVYTFKGGEYYVGDRI